MRRSAWSRKRTMAACLTGTIEGRCLDCQQFTPQQTSNPCSAVNVCIVPCKVRSPYVGRTCDLTCTQRRGASNPSEPRPARSLRHRQPLAANGLPPVGLQPHPPAAPGQPGKPVTGAAPQFGRAPDASGLAPRGVDLRRHRRLCGYRLAGPAPSRIAPHFTPWRHHSARVAAMNAPNE